MARIFPIKNPPASVLIYFSVKFPPAVFDHKFYRYKSGDEVVYGCNVFMKDPKGLYHNATQGTIAEFKKMNNETT